MKSGMWQLDLKNLRGQKTLLLTKTSITTKNYLVLALYTSSRAVSQFSFYFPSANSDTTKQSLKNLLHLTNSETKPWEFELQPWWSL